MLKKVKFILVFISLSVCLCFMSSTYSRYVAGTTGNIDALFANWQILVSDTDITNSTGSTIAFTPVIEENVNVANNKIAPSSKGYFDIDINPTNVDVSFRYSINLAMANESMPDIKMTKYAVIPQDYVEGNPLETFNITDNIITDTLTFDNNIEAFAFETFTVRVYFEWYEGENELMNDASDTQLGLQATTEGLAFTMNANISFEQVIE